MADPPITNSSVPLTDEEKQRLLAASSQPIIPSLHSIPPLPHTEEAKLMGGGTITPAARAGMVPPMPTAKPGVDPAYGQQLQERLDYQKMFPWGTPQNHPGTWGKIGHVAGTIGNVLGQFAPSIAEAIPGSFQNRQMQERQAAAWTKLGGETEERQALAEKAKADVPLEQAQTKHMEAEAAAAPRLYESEIAERNAHAASLLAPQAKTAFEEWEKQNPNEPVSKWLELQAENKAEAKPSETDKFVTDYLAEHNLPDTPANRQQARERMKGLERAPAQGSWQPLYSQDPAHPGQIVGAWNPATGAQRTQPVAGGTTAGGMAQEAREQAREQFIPAIAQQVVQAMGTQQSTRRLLQILEPYKNDNQPFGNFLKTVEYRLGKAQADEIGRELAAINLTSLQQGGAVLKTMGGVRSAQVLEQVLAHTPNPMKDSTALMYDKMLNIDRATSTFLQEANQYGRKQAVELPAESMAPYAPGGAAGGHSFTFNGKQYTGVPDELYNKYKGQPGFKE